jgi:hypothetical protein
MSYFEMVNEREFADRLERDKNTNVNVSEKFNRALEVELNFLEASSRPNIDYCNLGNYMKYIMEEFEHAYLLKKSQRIGEELKE